MNSVVNLFSLLSRLLVNRFSTFLLFPRQIQRRKTNFRTTSSLKREENSIRFSFSLSFIFQLAQQILQNKTLNDELFHLKIDLDEFKRNLNEFQMISREKDHLKTIVIDLQVRRNLPLTKCFRSSISLERKRKTSSKFTRF